MTRKKRIYKKNKIVRGEPPNYLGQHLMHNKKLLLKIVMKQKLVQMTSF